MASPVTYNQSVGVEGGQQRNPIVQGPQDPTGHAMQQLGGALDNASSAATRYQDTQQAIEDQKAVNEAHVTVAKASADAYQQFADWQDAQGDNPDGFTPKVMKSYDQFTQRIVADTPNAKAQQFMRASFANLGVHMQDKAISWEAQQGVEYQGTQILNAGKAYARLLGNDDSAYGPVSQGMHAMIDAKEKMPLKVKNHWHEQIDELLKTAAATGYAARNPKGAQGLANDALGVVPPSTVAAGPVERVEGIYTTPDGSQPLGVRNNNPGNIRTSDAHWQGATGENRGFVTFDTPEAGIRALGKNLLTYQDKYGRDTVRGIVSKWAPPGENDTAAYVAAVAKETGLAPDAKLNLRDPATMTALAGAIIHHENGKAPYTPAQIQAGVQAALGTAELPRPAPQTPVQMANAMADTMTDVAPTVPADPNATIKTPKDAPAWAEKMSTANWHAMKTHADAEIARQQGVEQARLRVAMTDAGVAAERGMSPVIPSLAEFQSAYGNTVGQAHYNSALTIQKTGQLVGSIQTMTPAQMEATRAQALAKLSDPALQPGELQTGSHSLTMIDSAIATTQKVRNADPIAAAGAQKLAKVSDIDWNSAPAALTELKSRQGVSILMHDKHGVGDFGALQKHEAAALSKLWESGTPTEQGHMLEQMRTALSDPRVYRATIQQIRPDSPVTGMSGALIVKSTEMQQGTGVFGGGGVTITPKQAVNTMLRGESLINATKQAKGEDGKPGRPAQLPPELELKTQWTKAVGNAFRGDPVGEAAAYQAYRSFYAGKGAELGILNPTTADTSIAEQAAAVATGGIYQWKGGKSGDTNTAADSGQVVKPWGMSDPDFLDNITKAYSQAASTASYKLPPLDAVGLIHKHTADGDIYFLTAGGKPLVDRGRMIELNVTPVPFVSRAGQVPQ